MAEDPEQADAEFEEDVIDEEQVARMAALIVALGDQDPAARQAAEDALVELGPPVLDRLRFACTDPRRPADERARAGGVIGRIGDPFLSGPELLGPFCEVPGGQFRMGATPDDPEGDSNAMPQHEIDLPTFQMTRFPVTNQAFALFVEDAGYERQDLWLEDGWTWRETMSVTAPNHWGAAPKRPNHPVVGVCWYEALAYSRWVTARMTARGELSPGERVHVPNEAEWEKSARGGLTLDRRRVNHNPYPERRYPWGNSFFVRRCSTAESELGATCPVGMFPDGASPYRVEGLGGNVMEWCSSQPGGYPYAPHDGRERPEGGPRTYRITRGGAWPFNGDSARCSHRHWQHAGFRGSMIGIRLVRDRPPR